MFRVFCSSCSTTSTKRCPVNVAIQTQLQATSVHLPLCHSHMTMQIPRQRYQVLRNRGIVALYIHSHPVRMNVLLFQVCNIGYVFPIYPFRETEGKGKLKLASFKRKSLEMYSTSSHTWGLLHKGLSWSVLVTFCHCSIE